MPKNIVIFSDGTGQAGGIALDETRSNIYKLYCATRVGPDSSINPAEQVAYYDAGLGSRPPGGGMLRTAWRTAHNFLSQATGFGLTTNITDCYEMIIRLWRPGDRIFLFGFSRGAYTVRCVGGVLSLCGVPTQLEQGPDMKEPPPMIYDSATARRLAKIAVKKVYQHTASRPRVRASKRQLELMDQRDELARQFRETYASRQSDKTDYPFFIGVFDTVSSIANKGALLLLVAAAPALAAAASTALWFYYPTYGPWVLNIPGRLFALAGLNINDWWHGFYFFIGAIILFTLIWYLKEHVKFAPSANPNKWWRTLTFNFGRMSFQDKTLNDNVRYARHAISIDENRASFPRVRWGDPTSTRPYQDEKGIITFRQYWFAGNHSDVGGSYPENESRLSDIALAWMIDAAESVEGGLKIDRSRLQLYPRADGMQHDQRQVGFPILTKWLGLNWKPGERKIPRPDTTLHESVYERFKLPAVLHYNVMRPYRPEALRDHAKLKEYYPEPKA